MAGIAEMVKLFLYLNHSCYDLIVFSARSKYEPSNSVGIGTGYGLDDGGVASPSRVNNVHFSIPSRPPLGPIQPPVQWVLGLFPRG
jgi:hypothetical protein